MWWRGLSAVLIGGLLALPWAPVWAAAPSCILVDGDDLATPLLLDDWGENYELIATTEISGAPVPEAETRPRLTLSAFWGREGMNPRCPADLNPVAAGTTGAFYPQHGTLPALIEWNDATGQGGGGRHLGELTTSARTILERHGLAPQTVTEPSPPGTGNGLLGESSGRGSYGTGATAAAGVGLLIFATWALFATKRR